MFQECEQAADFQTVSLSDVVRSQFDIAAAKFFPKRLLKRDKLIVADFLAFANCLDRRVRVNEFENLAFNPFAIFLNKDSLAALVQSYVASRLDEVGQVQRDEIAGLFALEFHL